MTEKDLAIVSFTGENRFLSNFYPAIVHLEGMQFPTVEHAYQAAKTLDLEIRDIIANLTSPGLAKRMGHKLALRPDWDDRMRLRTMESLLLQKFHPERVEARLLINTGWVHIVEGNTWGDTFWGAVKGQDGNWFGDNHLGEILMDIRRRLRL